MSSFRGRGRGRGFNNSQQRNKVVTSAIVVMPPADLWEPIQEIRSKHDKAYARWMPHINMAYPFVPESEFENARIKLTNALSNFTPFTLTLNTFSYFKQGLGCTVHIHPETTPPNALKALQAILEREFPDCNDLSQISADGFHPHLTVGQWNTLDATNKAIKNFSSNWKPITITIEQIYLISRSAVSSFEITHTIPFGNSKKMVVHEKIQDEIQLEPQAEWEFHEVEELKLDESNLQSEVTLLFNSKDDSISTLNAKPVSEMDKIYEKIFNWYNSNKTKGHIPKTKYKLQNAIKSFCYISQTVEVTKVFEALKESNCITVRGERIIYNKEKLGNLDSTDSYNDYNKSALDIVALKAKKWVLASADPPKSNKGFMSCLSQMCKVKTPIEPEKVVEYLINNRLISIDFNDIVTYNF